MLRPKEEASSAKDARSRAKGGKLQKNGADRLMRPAPMKLLPVIDYVTSTSSMSKIRSLPASGWFASNVTLPFETSLITTTEVSPLAC